VVFDIDRDDRILIAKTGYGKSVVPQLLPLLTRSSVVIILLPLNALGADSGAARGYSEAPTSKTNLALGEKQ
jgi:superfamily II DNA helicase RecQ